MKKNLTIILTIFSTLLILDSLRLGDAVIMFLLAGVIPGTNIAISGAQMLEFYLLIIGFMLGRVTMYIARNFKLGIFKNPQLRF